jgi:hypothetical protein
MSVHEDGERKASAEERDRFSTSYQLHPHHIFIQHRWRTPFLDNPPDHRIHSPYERLFTTK